MKEQERKFSLAEVHTRVGTEGEIIFNQEFMELLRVRPGDWISFLINEQGVVTVKGERKSADESALAAPTGEVTNVPRPDEVTQPTFFSIDGAE